MPFSSFRINALVKCALIAGLYTVLSLAIGEFSFGMVQLRIGESLCMLAVFSPVAVAGAALGCLLTNLFGTFMGLNILGMWDVLFGTLATLTAAYLTYGLRKFTVKDIPVLSVLPPVLINAAVIGAELMFAITGGVNMPVFLLNALYVGLGQALACGVLGIPLVMAIKKTGLEKKLFPG